MKLRLLFFSLLFCSSSPLFRRVRPSPPANVHVFCPASVNLLQFPSRAWFEHQIFLRDKRMWFRAPLACLSRSARQNSDHTHPCWPRGTGRRSSVDSWEITGMSCMLLGEWSPVPETSADYLCIGIQTPVRFKSLKLITGIFSSRPSFVLKQRFSVLFCIAINCLVFPLRASVCVDLNPTLGFCLMRERWKQNSGDEPETRRTEARSGALWWIGLVGLLWHVSRFDSGLKSSLNGAQQGFSPHLFCFKNYLTLRV